MGFDISTVTGLTREEAVRRLEEEGYNELGTGGRRQVLRMALDILREPMFLLLIGGGIIYLLLGERQEAVILLSFVFVIIGITFYQERKTERALEALRDLSSPRALVIRDGVQDRIAGREVARGDVLVLQEGDRVPADAMLLDCAHMNVDESLLTGESVPVRKFPCEGSPGEIGKPGGDDLPFVYSGTLVVQGHGIAEVQATGEKTEMGKIGTALTEIEPERTPLQKETGRLVRLIAIFALGFCVVVVVIYAAINGIDSGDAWLEGLLVGVALSMAILPEEFPVVLTIFLTLGAWRMSKRNVLTRQVPAVETLGSADVLCVDKTGTLTLNHMTVNTLFAGGEYYELDDPAGGGLPERFHELVEFSILASQREAFDPVDRAFQQLGDLALAQTEHLHHDWALEREYPLSQALLALSHVWKSPDSRDYVIAAKGAPEAIADLCHFSEVERQVLSAHIETMAEQGLRVLGVAKAHFSRSSLPPDQHDFRFEFLGMVGLADPVRPTVPAALKECYSAGIRVVMITGDYPGTAQNIADQIGLTPRDEFITGPELDAMSDEELQERIRTVNIFARVVPEQKLRLVKALKSNGDVTAMTGDGVNDAPALKAADIGIAMGERGTDVAREAAALVLLDDDFSSIEGAVRMGRRIFDNLKKAMAYIVAVHVPIAGMSFIPVLFKLPLVLLPVHIAFLELIIDPACSVVFEAEPEEDDVMLRPPREPGEPLFSRRTLILSVLQGLSVLAVVCLVFAISHWRGQGEEETRALTFTALVISNLALIFINRSWHRTIRDTLRVRNAALWWITGGTMVFLGLALYVPFMRELFGFALLHVEDLAICLAAGVLGVIWFELLKIFTRRRAI